MKANYKNKTMDYFKDMLKNTIPFQEGQKVKLDIKQIKSHPDYSIKTEKYRNWIEKNQDKIFTVEYDKDKSINPKYQVCLKEDVTKPKWLFWTGELIEVSDDGRN